MLTKALKCPQTVGQRQVSNVHPTWCQLVPNDAQRVAVKEAQLEPTKFPSGPWTGPLRGLHNCENCASRPHACANYNFGLWACWACKMRCKGPRFGVRINRGLHRCPQENHFLPILGAPTWPHFGRLFGTTFPMCQHRQNAFYTYSLAKHRFSKPHMDRALAKLGPGNGQPNGQAGALHCCRPVHFDCRKCVKVDFRCDRCAHKRANSGSFGGLTGRHCRSSSLHRCPSAKQNSITGAAQVGA